MTADDSHVMSSIIFSEKYEKHALRISPASHDWSHMRGTGSVEDEGINNNDVENMVGYTEKSQFFVVSAAEFYCISLPLRSRWSWQHHGSSSVSH